MNNINNPQCPTCQNTTSSFLTGAAIGAVIGAVIGLMLSPGTGAENRRNFSKMANKTKRFVEDKAQDLEEAYEDLKEDTTDFIHQVEKKATPLKKQAVKFAAGALENVEDTAKETRKKFFKGVKL